MKDMCRVLFIDPDPKYLSFAAKALKNIDVDVTGVTGLKSAQHALKTLKGIRLIFIDLEFTEKAPEQIRKLIEPHKRFVVVQFPVKLNPHEMSRVFKLGVYDCIDKSYDTKQLRRQVEILTKETCPPDNNTKSKTTPHLVHAV